MQMPKPSAPRRVRRWGCVSTLTECLASFLGDKEGAAGCEETGLSFTALLALAAPDGSVDGLTCHAEILQRAGWDQTFPQFSRLLRDIDCPVSMSIFGGTIEPLCHWVKELHARWHQAGCPQTEWPSSEAEVLAVPCLPHKHEG